MKFRRTTKPKTELVDITTHEVCSNVRNASQLAIFFDSRMFGAVLGECTSIMQETEQLQERPKRVYCGLFLWFEANWAIFGNPVPPGKPDTKTTETFDPDPTPDPTRAGKKYAVRPHPHSDVLTIKTICILNISID